MTLCGSALLLGYSEGTILLAIVTVSFYDIVHCMCRAGEEKGKVLRGGVQVRETGGGIWERATGGEGDGEGKLLGEGYGKGKPWEWYGKGNWGEGQGIGNLSNQGWLG